MQKFNSSQIKKRAFSLIELSVVITIAALIATAVIALNNSSAINDKNKITNQRIQKVYQAMGVFLTKNGRLPCPASLLLAKTNSGYGTEVNPCVTITAGSGIFQNIWLNNIIYGMVPSKTLGLPSEMAEDGFGNKLSYVLMKGFTDAAKFNIDDETNYIYNDSQGAICQRLAVYKSVDGTYTELTAPGSGYSYGSTTGSHTCNTTYPSNQQAMFVIISYGANKYGGFPATGTSQDSASFSASNFPSTSSDEYYNMAITCSSGSATCYYYNYTRDTTTVSVPGFIKSSNSTGFDDIVFYKTRDDMIADFRLYNLIPCEVQTISSYGYPTAYYGEIAQATSKTGGGNCPNWATIGVKFPTRRCGLFGTWESNEITPCS